MSKPLDSSFAKVVALTVSIVVSDEPPSPEYLVVLFREHGFEEVARIDCSSPGAMAKIRERAEDVAELLEVTENMWFEEGLLIIASE